MGGPGSTSDERDVTLGPGTRLGKYEVVRLLGAGGMGAVYEAVHTEIGKRVAIKVLSPAIAAVPGARARFLREAQLTSRVRHPNIVDVTDMGSDGGQTYLVMEFLRGEDLAQRLTRTGPIPARELADIMLPVCSAVVAAHQVGVTHRDLKPQNIFLATGPHAIQPKVLDFGISKGDDLVGAGSLTGTGAMIGTPFYLAPEQIMDTRSAGPPSDQYALGVILYECLTGHRPFDAENLFVVFQAIVTGSPPRPRDRRPDIDIPPALEEVVIKAMNVDPKARFISTQELGRVLLPFASARTRSIWEEAFSIPGSEVAPAGGGSLGGGDVAPTPTPPVRMPTPQPGARASQTPATRPQWGGPATPPPVMSVRPSTPVTPSGDAALARKRRDVVQTPALEHSRESFAGRTTEDLDTLGGPVPRSRGLMWIGIAGGVTVGLIVALFAFRTSPRVSAPEAARAPVAAPVAVPARPAASLPPTAASQRAAPASGVGSPKTYKVSVSVVPDTAAIELDDVPAGRGQLERTLPADHMAHRLRLSADGFDPRTFEFTDAPPPPQVTLTRRSRPEPAPTITPVAPRPARHPRPRGPAVHSLNPNGAPVID